MNRLFVNGLLGGTLVLGLASLASAAPQTPATAGNQAGHTVNKQTAKKGASKRHHRKGQTGGKHKNNQSKPVK